MVDMPALGRRGPDPLWLTKTLHRHSVHAIPQQDTDLPISWGKGIECMTKLAEPKVSNDRSSDTRSAALSALGSLGGFRRVSFVAVVQSTDLTQRHDWPDFRRLNRARLR